MSSYECQEPGCDFNIYAAGPILTDEDMEAQDYFEDEIRDHERQHEEEAAIKALDRAMLVNEVADEVMRRITELLATAERPARASSGTTEPKVDTALADRGSADAGHSDGITLEVAGKEFKAVLSKESKASLINDAVAASMERLKEDVYSVKIPTGRTLRATRPAVEEVAFAKQRNVDPSVLECDSQGPDRKGILESEPQSNGGVFKDGAERIVFPRYPDHAFSVGDGSVDVLADVHETSPSVGAPSGAGVGTSDPTGGDEAGVLGEAPGAPCK